MKPSASDRVIERSRGAPEEGPGGRKEPGDDTGRTRTGGEGAGTSKAEAPAKRGRGERAGLYE